MDGSRFDALAKALSGPDSRRRVLGLLASLPLLGGVVGVLDLDVVEAKDRRRRRKQRHKTRKDKSKNKRKSKKGCTPKSRARVCAGKCGPLKSRQTCGKTVDCGSCDCSPPCGECFTCQGTPGAPGTCVPQDGAPCGTATCTDGVLQPQGRCDGDGVCRPAAPISCDPYLQCDGNACATSCGDDRDCVDGSYCEGGQCVGDGEDGARCDHDGQCASGHCVEEVCCDSSCTEECKACNLPGLEGTCSPRDSGTPCGAATRCDEGTLYPQGTCNGRGTCQDAASVSCTPYAVCDGNACATSCRGNTDCNSGYFCDLDQATCLPVRPNGAACETETQCLSGHCVDDVCCTAACAGVCEACDLAGTRGTCTPLTGTVCGDGNICCSGTCQECCDDTQCRSTAAPICVAGECAACSANPGQCPSGTCCRNDGSCAVCPMPEVCFEQKCCTPATCASLGKTCGSWPDGCGGTLQCGTCGTGATPTCNNGTCDTCANTCGSDCSRCLNLTDGTTLCSAQVGFDCSTTCSSNADCQSELSCTTNVVWRETGRVDPVSDICGPPAVCGARIRSCSPV